MTGDAADRRVRHRDGFTLLEVVVVLAILATAVLLVYPKLSSTGDAGLRSSARSLAATIRYLDDRAKTTGFRYCMKLHPGSADIEIRKIAQDGDELPVDDVFLGRNPVDDGIVVADVIASRRGRVAGGEVRVGFGPLGIDDYTAIHLCSPRDRFYTVRIYPRSGRVRVFEQYSGVTR